MALEKIDELSKEYNQKSLERFILKFIIRKRIKQAINKQLVKKTIDVASILGEKINIYNKNNPNREPHYHYIFKENGLEIECDEYIIDNCKLDGFGFKILKKEEEHKPYSLNFIGKPPFSILNDEDLVFGVSYGFCNKSKWHGHIIVYKPGKWEEVLEDLHKSEKIKDYFMEKENKKQFELIEKVQRRVNDLEDSITNLKNRYLI